MAISARPGSRKCEAGAWEPPATMVDHAGAAEPGTTRTTLNKCGPVRIAHAPDAQTKRTARRPDLEIPISSALAQWPAPCSRCVAVRSRTRSTFTHRLRDIRGTLDHNGGGGALR